MPFLGARDKETPADYTVVVPAYNEQGFLPHTLAILRAAMESIELAGRVIVVDNDSSDGTAEIARAEDAEVLFESRRQIARARNAGGHHASSRYLIFVDADTLVSERLLRATLEALESGRVCGGGAPFVFDEAPRWMRGLARIVNGGLRLCGLAAGSYVYCLREGFLETGGFDERVYAAEEIAFSRALRLWGRRRSLRFRVQRHAVVTSGRKLQWFGARRLWRECSALLINPRRLRDRERCDVWYARPSSTRPRNSDSEP